MDDETYDTIGGIQIALDKLKDELAGLRDTISSLEGRIEAIEREKED